MKTKPANDIDLARLKKRVREVFHTTRAAEQAFVKARDFAAARRLELGQLLAEARAYWPRRGRNASGWGDFLRDVGIDEDVALDAMEYAGYVERNPGPRPGKLPTLREAGIRRDVLNDPRDPEPPKPNRGAWCTPEPIAKAVGPWDVDPFSNDRSHIIATVTCELERGDNGFGLESVDRRVPGRYFTKAGGHATADHATKVWFQPDYGDVLEAIAHYKHTRFCALLRLDTSTEWFDVLHGCSKLILIPKGNRIQFDPPPGVEASSNPYPHGLFYRHANDATKEIRALCYEWRV